MYKTDAMYITLSGIVMLVKPLQPENVPPPTLVTLGAILKKQTQICNSPFAKNGTVKKPQKQGRALKYKALPCFYFTLP